MDSKPFGFVGAFISSVGVFANVGEVESIVSIICSIVGLLITLTAVVIIPVVKWWIKAKEDGKITKEELEELEETLKDSQDKLDSNKKE